MLAGSRGRPHCDSQVFSGECEAFRAGPPGKRRRCRRRLRRLAEGVFPGERPKPLRGIPSIIPRKPMPLFSLFFPQVRQVCGLHFGAPLVGVSSRWLGEGLRPGRPQVNRPRKPGVCSQWSMSPSRLSRRAIAEHRAEPSVLRLARGTPTRPGGDPATGLRSWVARRPGTRGRGARPHQRLGKPPRVSKGVAPYLFTPRHLGCHDPLDLRPRISRAALRAAGRRVRVRPCAAPPLRGLRKGRADRRGRTATVLRSLPTDRGPRVAVAARVLCAAPTPLS